MTERLAAGLVWVEVQEGDRKPCPTCMTMPQHFGSAAPTERNPAAWCRQDLPTVAMCGRCVDLLDEHWAEERLDGEKTDDWEVNG